jgi:hypothetical protein
MAIGIAGSQDPRSVAITDEGGREPRKQLDLATAQLGESGGPPGNRQVGTSKGAMLPECLKSLP